MGKNVTFGLGQAVGLASRLLTITRMYRAGDDSAPAAEVTATLAGSDESSTQTLPDNTIWQATLVDTKSTGEESDPDILNFHTGELQFPGPKTGDRLCILSMEDLSSSSSSSSSSVSTSSISTSSNSSSNSSSSNSSSSISTSSHSSSSISTSSNSSSSSSSQSSEGT